MAKVMKKAQTGKNVPKGMVESEMFPGKMIPKSKSNYENSNYAKMLGAKKAPAAKPKAKVVVKPKAQKGVKTAMSGKPIYKSPYSSKKTADSTDYFTKKKEDIKRAYVNVDETSAVTKKDRQNKERILEDYDNESKSALSDLFRQYKKGTPGFNANGFPVTYKEASSSKKSFGGKMKSGGMLKRADGSYSKRGLWDNIRANKGSGKKPTAQMLKQEKKIKAKTK
jgi:hypothetical protein